MGRSVQVLEGICIGQIFYFALFLPTYHEVRATAIRWTPSALQRSIDSGFPLGGPTVCRRGRIHGLDPERSQPALVFGKKHPIEWVSSISRHVKGFRVGALTEYTTRGYQAAWGWSKIGHERLSRVEVSTWVSCLARPGGPQPGIG